MLEKKLLKASYKKRKQGWHIFLLLLGLAILAILFLLEFIQLNPNALNMDSPPSVIESKLGTTKKDLAHANLEPKINSMNGIAEKTSVISSNNTEINSKVINTPESIEIERENFKDLLLIFNTNIAPIVKSGEFIKWNIDKYKEILSLYDIAIESANSGNYAQANLDMSKTIDFAESELETRSKNFLSAMKNATIGYSNENYEYAKSEIEIALAIHPSNRNAIALKHKIDLLPQLADLKADLATARIENNIAKQQRLLQTIIALDPTQIEFRKELHRVSEAIAKKQFSQYISDGLQSISDGDIGLSEKYLKQAQAIFPDRDEITFLDKKIEATKDEIRFKKLMDEADFESKNDRWDIAKILYDKAQQIASNDKTLLERIALANEIIDIQNKLKAYTNRPKRLSNREIEKSAKALIRIAQSLHGHSGLLDELSMELNNLIVAYTTVVPVRIISDMVTEISVRSMGTIGRVTDYTINLRPGKYGIEGKRDGYRNILIWINLSPHITNFSVTVICNEPI